MARVAGLVIVLTLFAPVFRMPALLGTQSRTISRTEVHSYLVFLAAGQHARISITQHEIDLHLAVYRPDETLAANIDASPWGREELSVIAEVGGLFRVEVQPDPHDSLQGSYRINIGNKRRAGHGDYLRVKAQNLFSEAARLEKDETTSKEKVIHTYRHAAETWGAANEALGEAQALRGFADACHRMGKFGEADPAYLRAIRLFAAVKDEPASLNTRNAWSNQGGYLLEERASLKDMEGRLSSWQLLEDRRGVAAALSAISGYHRSRDPRSWKAAMFENQSLNLRRELGNIEDEARSLENLAYIYLDLRDYEKAAECAQNSIAISRRIGNRKQEIGRMAPLCAIYQKSGKINQARECYLEMLAYARQIQERNSELRRLLDLAQLETENERFSHALSYLRQAEAVELKITNDLRDPLLSLRYGSQSAYYRTAWSILQSAHGGNPRAGYDRQAFLGADRARAKFIRNPSVPSLAAIQAALNEGIILLEYFVGGPTEASVWVITQDTFAQIRLSTTVKIPRVARNLYDALTARNQWPKGESQEQRRARLAEADGQVKALAAELSCVLLAPVAHRIQGKRLLVVPDESFGFIPFGLLPDPQQPTRPLAESTDILQVPSALAVLEQRKWRAQRSKPKRLLAIVSDPVYSTGESIDPGLREATRSVGLSMDGTRIPRLPFVLQEAAAIARQVPGAECTRHLGYEATSEALLREALPNHQVIHVGSHGIVNGEKPELSGLILSLIDRKGNPRRGYLPLRDLLGSEFTPELVTLGACQTAVGRELHGYGVISLTAALLRAGAARVLASTWKVDDEATFELMVKFYEGLLKDKMQPAAALRRAQRAMASQERWRQPYYHAAFSLYGDWADWTRGENGHER